MKQTVSIKQNSEFRRLYGKGRSAASFCLAVYCRRNRYGYNRLGLTVSTKVGKAVVRNRVRRRLREAYRVHEDRYAPGWDIVVVARVRAAFVRYRELERNLLRLSDKLGLLLPEAGQ